MKRPPERESPESDYLGLAAFYRSLTVMLCVAVVCFCAAVVALVAA